MDKLLYGECIHHNNMASCHLCKNPNQTNVTLRMEFENKIDFLNDLEKKLFVDFENGFISFGDALKKYSYEANLENILTIEELKTKVGLGDLASQNCRRLEAELKEAKELIRKIHKSTIPYIADKELHEEVTTFLNEGVCYKCGNKTDNSFDICNKCNTGWSK